jgi:hypothetical protein
MAKLQAELEAGRARYQALEAEVKASFKEKTPLKTFKRDK